MIDDDNEETKMAAANDVGKLAPETAEEDSKTKDVIAMNAKKKPKGAKELNTR